MTRKNVTKFEAVICDFCELVGNTRHTPEGDLAPERWSTFELQRKWYDICFDCMSSLDTNKTSRLLLTNICPNYHLWQK